MQCCNGNVYFQPDVIVFYRVLTGVRLVKKNRIIHIQIQQGVLEPHGVINTDTLSWKPVDNYTVEDEHVENNVDYHTMSWLERTIDVDDIEGQPGQTITGKFNYS